ncbi:hypothetical protein BC940DRAFT_334976 [Gongronella butleri]|nr:hypothetical protein BC940DRAFT_334976 [Gongronella butleri]
MPTLNGRAFASTTSSLRPLISSGGTTSSVAPPTPPLRNDGDDWALNTTPTTMEQPTSRTSYTTGYTSTNTRESTSIATERLPPPPMPRQPSVQAPPPARPPRIPRLRHPTMWARPGTSSPISISSAITTTSARLHPHDQCLDTLDLSALFGDTINQAITVQDGYRYLDFRLKADHPSALTGVESYVSYHDGGVYRILNCEKAVDLMLEYVGCNTSCSVSQLIIRSPHTGNGFLPKSREGMIFISHDLRGVKNTQRFNDFTKQDFDEYQDIFHDDRVAAWFRLVEDKPTVIDLQERSGRYVLIKLFPTENELIDSTVDLLYIAVLGYVGARSFGHGKLL